MVIIEEQQRLEEMSLSDKILSVSKKVLETSPIDDLVESMHSGVVTPIFN